MPGADPVLNARARLTDLDHQIDDATAEEDPERAARASAERDFPVAELTAATGLGRRSRRLGDESDKARKTVTARIRYAIDRVRPVHPALAAHLDDHIHTGFECAYQPDDPISLRL